MQSLIFFLLLAQKKETKKKAAKNKCSAVFGKANAHEQSSDL